MKVISFISVKGGVGKTTLTVNTANELASRVGGSERVLVVDLDAQAGATIYLLGYQRQQSLEKEGRTVYKLLEGVIRGGAQDPSSAIVQVGEGSSRDWSKKLDLIPGDSRIISIEQRAIAEAAAGGYAWLNLLRSLLPRLEDLGYSYVFIDPPATLGVLPRMTLAAADYFILPVIPDDFGRVSFRLFVGEVFNDVAYQLARAGRTDLPLCGGVVFNKVEPNSATHSKIADEIEKEVSRAKLYGKYPIPVYKSRLRNYIAYVKSLEKHVPLAKVGDKDGSKNAREDFAKFFDEFYDYVVKDGVKRAVEGD